MYRFWFHLRAVVLLAAALAGTACSARVVSSGINQTGPDTYTLAVRAGRLRGGIIGAERRALSEAGDHCRQQGRGIRVLPEKPMRGGYRVSFRCLAAGDPELHRT